MQLCCKKNNFKGTKVEVRAIIVHIKSMAKLIVTCVMLCVGLQLKAQDTTYYTTGTVKSVDARDSTQKSGPWIYYYPNGKLLAVEEYENGKLSGIVKYYDEQGSLIGKEKWIEGLLYDSAIYYYPNGQVEKQGQFDEGRYTGI